MKYFAKETCIILLYNYVSKKMVWQEDSLVKAMLLQWRMHSQLYALYFVIYDCIYPKYILSYLISTAQWAVL